MKVGVLATGLFGFGLIGSAVSLTNLNAVALLIDDATYDTSTGAGMASNMENFDVTEEAKEAGLKDQYGFGAGGLSSDGQWMQIIEEMTIGSAGGGSAGSINLMWLLQNAKDPDKSSYAYQLLEVYSKNEQGAYNDNKYHVTPEAIIGSHFNETRLGSFALPNPSGYAEGKIANGVHLEDTTKAHAVSASGSSVYKDATGDGNPDGPFQIEEGATFTNKHVSKKRADGKVDLYSFVDALNVIDGKYNEIVDRAVSETGSKPDQRALAAVFALAHNRGESGAGWMTHGLPYKTSGIYSASDYIKNSRPQEMTGAQIKAHLYYPSKLVQWFDKYNLPPEATIGYGRGIAILLIMKEGGFIDIPLTTTSKARITELPESVYSKIYPNMTPTEIIADINAKNIKKPWDFMGMSESEYNKIYAGSKVAPAGYQSIYRNGAYNTLFWSDKTQKTDNYTTGTQTMIGALEGIAAGYVLDTSSLGAFVLLKVAETAGIKTLLDGTVVDPTNPSNLYQGTQGTQGQNTLKTIKVVKWVKVNKATNQSVTTTAQTSQPAVYNPVAAGVDGDFGEFLKSLNLYGKLTLAQMGQIETVYEIAGGPYGQQDPPRNSRTKDGRLVTDCSLWASFMFLMDRSKDHGWNTDVIKKGLPLTSKKQTKPYGGRVWNAYGVQITTKGKSMPRSEKFDFSQSMPDYEWVKVMQTGDMANGRGSAGHIWTYLTQNKTGKQMVIPMEVSKSNAAMSTHKPDTHISYESSGYLKGYQGNMMGLQHKGKPYSWDRSGIDYQAFRAIYLPQK